MKENNTGLGLIKTTIERVQTSELFTSALKKFVNSNEVELQKFLGDVKRVLKNLTLLCKIFVPEVEAFIVGEKFKHRSKKEIGIQMYIEDNFKNWILNPMKNRTLSLNNEIMFEKFNLNKLMNDSQIKDELGNPKSIHITIFFPFLLYLLRQQSNGEIKENGLLNNGYTNIFYVELEDGRVVVVGVRWRDDEWDHNAYGLGCNFPWRDGHSFFTPAIGN